MYARAHEQLQAARVHVHVQAQWNNDPVPDLIMALGPADKGHSPFPSPERAFYGFACYLSSYLVAGEPLAWLATCRVLTLKI